MTYEEALTYTFNFWKGIGIKEPDPSVMKVMADAVVKLDEMGVETKEPYVAMLYDAFFTGYKAGRDGKRLS